MVSELGKMFGYQRPGGVFCPGGSYSNLHAMLTARNSRLPELADVSLCVTCN